MKKKTKQIRVKGTLVDNIQMFILQLPAIILFIVFDYIPMYGAIIAFKDFRPRMGIWGSPWVGIENFKFFFASQDAAVIIRNTLLYNLTFLILTTAASVTVALLLYNLSKRWLVKTYNTIMILPKFMSIVLISFIVYAILNPASGIANQAIEFFGGEAIDWYSKPAAWPYILTFIHIWQCVGYSSIIYYAALMGINPELFEAATIDGASKFQQTWNIAIPEIMSLIVIQTILALGGLFGGDFGLFYQVPRNVSTLYPTTDIISTYTFRALMGGDMAKSSAVGLMQSVVGTFLIVVVNAVVRKISPEDSLF